MTPILPWFPKVFGAALRVRLKGNIFERMTRFLPLVSKIFGAVSRVQQKRNIFERVNTFLPWFSILFGGASRVRQKRNIFERKTRFLPRFQSHSYRQYSRPRLFHCPYNLLTQRCVSKVVSMADEGIRLWVPGRGEENLSQRWKRDDDNEIERERKFPNEFPRVDHSIDRVSCHLVVAGYHNECDLELAEECSRFDLSYVCTHSK